MYALRPGLSIPCQAIWLAILLSPLVLPFPAQTGSQGTAEAVPLHTAISSGPLTRAGMSRRVNSDACLTGSEIAASLSRLGFTGIELGENVDTADMLVRAGFNGGRYLVRINRCTALLQDVSVASGEGSVN